MAPILEGGMHILAKRATVAERLAPSEEQKVTLYVLLAYGRLGHGTMTARAADLMRWCSHWHHDLLEPMGRQVHLIPVEVLYSGSGGSATRLSAFTTITRHHHALMSM